jgi:AraC-like DNA-binding protein
MATEKRFAFRPSAVPSEHVPIGARSVGDFSVDHGWKDLSFRKAFTQIFWGVEGEGEIVLDRESYTLGPGQIAVYLPGMRHTLRANHGNWRYCWWTLDGPHAVDIVKGFGLNASVVNAGPPPLDLFEELRNCIRTPSIAAEMEASSLAFRLITEAATRIALPNDPQGKSPMITKSVKLIQQYWSKSYCTIEFLSSRLDVHRSTLSKKFHAEVGCSISDYLARTRLQNAMSLLKETPMTVNEVATQCGYDDPNYFSRVFRKFTTKTPRAFRRES